MSSWHVSYDTPSYANNMMPKSFHLQSKYVPRNQRDLPHQPGYTANMVRYRGMFVPFRTNSLPFLQLDYNTSKIHNHENDLLFCFCQAKKKYFSAHFLLFFACIYIFALMLSSYYPMPVSDKPFRNACNQLLVVRLVLSMD